MARTRSQVLSLEGSSSVTLGGFSFFESCRASEVAMKKINIPREVLVAAVYRSVQDSAALEGRVVPPGFRRSQLVQDFLDQREL